MESQARTAKHCVAANGILRLHPFMLYLANHNACRRIRWPPQRMRLDVQKMGDEHQWRKFIINQVCCLSER